MSLGDEGGVWEDGIDDCGIFFHDMMVASHLFSMHVALYFWFAHLPSMHWSSIIGMGPHMYL